jgi:murein DD-endopeptidase MepM/ murein hydrolase activator NlpD
MKAAARVNQTTSAAEESGEEVKPAGYAGTDCARAGLFGMRDRLLVDHRSGGRPILIRAWQQAAVVGGAAVLGLGSVCALGLGLYAATRADVRALEARELALVTALELASNHVLDRQIELLDATTSRSGFIFVDNANVSIDALMADNERLLSTLEAALEPVDHLRNEGSVAAKSPGAASDDDANGAGLERLEYELALSQTQQDMLAAELNLERQTIETLSDALASVRVDVSVLERESLRLAQTLERRDELIAVLKRDLVAVQSDRAEGQDARRGTINLLNTQNDELISELRSLRNRLNGNADTLRSLQDQLLQSESEQARLATLVEQRDAQITILTDTQSGILEQLEAQVEQQMAALRSAIDMTGVDHDTSLQLDALLESVLDPFWNGMGGANDGISVPTEADLEEIYGDDAAAALVSDILDRVDALARRHAELALRRNHFDALPTSPPVEGLRLSSGFGMRKHPVTGKNRMHKGLDFAGPSGTRVMAAAAGRVIYAARKGSYGNLIELDHGNGVTTRYAHLRDIEVSKGDTVEMGELIGTVGSTGASTGPHLHWEVRVFERAKNPQLFLDAGRAVRK